MLESPTLHLTGSGLFTSAAIAVGQTPIPVAEVDVGPGSEFGLSAHARNPYQYSRGRHVQSKPRERLTIVFSVHYQCLPQGSQR
jgi:hypothetical protein